MNIVDQMNIPLTPIRFLERAIKVYGNKTAVICGKHRFSYLEHYERVNRLSNALLNLGVRKGDRISYLGYNCHRLLEGFYGIPQIGAVLSPLNIRLVPDDFRYILNESTPKVLFLDKDFVPQIKAVWDDLHSVEHVILLGDMENAPGWIGGTYEALMADASPEPPYPLGQYPFDEDDVAEIFYTSGTTGKPKGVMLTHRNVTLHAMSFLAVEPLDETEIQIHLIPLFHVNGWGTPHYLTAKGGTHIMLSKFDPVETMEIIQREKVTRFYIIPTMVNATLALPDFGDYDVSSVRRVLVGGAPPPTGMIERVEEAFGALTSTAFGMTEACPLIAWPELGPHLDPEIRNYRARKTWGFPMPGVEFKVGDLVSIGPDGSLFIKDRMKEIIISGGENISSLEVEQVLYSNPDILECAVVGKPDDRWGEVPVAFVVPREGSNLSPQDVIDFARSRMAHFKAPKEVRFIDQFPRGGTGKILKQV
ncbi:MAG: AMP-binding protein, partial [Deltaproteobacteria bacterium]|nr:AMP-binding protein [Deltaproteobacteria bacterium]